MSSWMVVAPCLTVKPHPDRSLVTEPDPSVHVHYEVLQFAVLFESFISVISPTPNAVVFDWINFILSTQVNHAYRNCDFIIFIISIISFSNFILFLT